MHLSMVNELISKPCLSELTHVCQVPCMTEQLGQLGMTQSAHWRLSAIRLHWGTLCFIPGNGAHVCWIEKKNIWLFITLSNRLINITLHIHIRVNIWLAFSCIMACIMIVSHTNRPDNFSQSPCTVPSCRLVGWLVARTGQFRRNWAWKRSC